MSASSELAISDFRIAFSVSRSSTARFTYWLATEDHSDLSQPALSRDAYRFVIEDLADIASAASDWSEDGLPPSADALQSAMEVLTRTVDVLPAPEVTAQPNGTLLMLWYGRAGFMSLELGTKEYGLLVTSEGRPSIRRNGTSKELQAFLPAPWAPIPVASNEYVQHSLFAKRQAELESGVSSTIGQQFDFSAGPRVAVAS